MHAHFSNIFCFLGTMCYMLARDVTMLRWWYLLFWWELSRNLLDKWLCCVYSLAGNLHSVLHYLSRYVGTGWARGASAPLLLLEYCQNCLEIGVFASNICLLPPTLGLAPLLVGKFQQPCLSNQPAFSINIHPCIMHRHESELSWFSKMHQEF